MAYPKAAPINGPVQGQAIMTAKKPVKKLLLPAIRLKQSAHLSGKGSLSVKFKKITKNSKNKKMLKLGDCS